MQRKRGFTLLESLVAGGLFVVLGLVAFTVFKYALAAYQRGLLGNEAQSKAREIVNKISTEIGASMPLQLPSGGSAVQSAVLYPSTEAAYSRDDFMFTAPATSNFSTLDTSKAQNYVLVRFAVHQHDRTKANDPPTALMRRVYRYDKVQGYVRESVEAGATKPSWNVNKGSLDTDKGGPGDNTHIDTTANDTPWVEVATLPNEYDMMTFVVNHDALTDTQAATTYDPFHFKIFTVVERYLGTPAKPVSAIKVDLVNYKFDPNDANDKSNDRILKDLSTEITLQRFQ